MCVQGVTVGARSAKANKDLLFVSSERKAMIVYLACIATAILVNDPDQLPSVSELQDSWGSYEREHCRRLSGTARFTFSSDSLSADYVVIYEIKRLGDSFVYARNDDGKGGGPVQLTARNTKYGFTLTRGSTSGPWRYTSSRLVAASYTNYRVEARMIGYLTRLPLYLFMTEESYLPLMLADPAIDVKLLRRPNSIGELNLSFRRANPKRISGFPIEGAIVLYDRPPYLIQSGGCTIEFYDENYNRTLEHCRIETIYDAALATRLRNVRRTFVEPERPEAATGKHEVDVQFDDGASLREVDFTLSHYGLPEPFGVEWPKPTPWFLYFSAGGFGLFFLAVFLWRVLAKRQARGVA
jgi:hypothetical protein